MPPLSRGFIGVRSARPPFLRQVRTIHARNSLFKVSEEVQDALATGKPVVALETTIYTHGFPYPENVALSSHLESLVRVNGGIPATIGILNGQALVGMQPNELIELVSSAGSENTWKISRRDLGFIGGLGLRGNKLNGGTTIAGTMILAHLAGIKIFATGGLGGVHRGAENSMDISADLTELGRTPVTVISSGCKSFLDIPRTLEYLETQGVGVGTFADGRDGAVDFPAFYSRDSGVRSPRVITNEADAAAIVCAQSKYPLHSGLLFANPVPADSEVPKAEMDVIIEKALLEAHQAGIIGAANTPYVLKRIKELSRGKSVPANRALISANVIRGTKVAVELAKLEAEEKDLSQR
jgi:pseudouridine-5'-phosphate glycosidase/pseudouridine kinase